MMALSGLPPRAIVISYGVFDMLSSDHLARLKVLAGLGHEVIIGCADDAYCADLGIVPRRSFAQRRAALQSCRYVSRVIAQTSAGQQRTDIVNYDVDILAMDSRWVGAFDGLEDVVKVHYLPKRTSPEQHVMADPYFFRAG